MREKEELIVYRKYLYGLIGELKTLKEKVDVDENDDWEDITTIVTGKLHEAEEEISDLIGKISVQLYFIEK